MGYALKLLCKNYCKGTELISEINDKYQYAIVNDADMFSLCIILNILY